MLDVHGIKLVCSVCGYEYVEVVAGTMVDGNFIFQTDPCPECIKQAKKIAAKEAREEMKQELAECKKAISKISAYIAGCSEPKKTPLPKCDCETCQQLWERQGKVEL